MELNLDQSHNYTIINFNQYTNEIEVYFKIHKLLRKISVPIVDGAYITGIDLDNYIMSFSPITNQPLPSIGAIANNPDQIQKLVNNKIYKKINNVNKTSELIKLRNFLLNNSDWTQIPDSYNKLTDEDKLLYKEYRQNLRDITKQKGWPNNIDWPKDPHTLGVYIF